MNLYPVNLNIKGKKCLIVGGGEVAERKAKELLQCDANICVISPLITPALNNLMVNGSIEWQDRKYVTDDLDGVFLVFAATDDKKVQDRILSDAEKKEILVNSADDPSACSFHVPAKVRRGDFLLTVSTGGGSPALAAQIRKKLEEEYGYEYQQFVELMGHIRERVVIDGDTQNAHKELFKKLLQMNILNQIQMQDWDTLHKELRAILPEDMDVNELLDSIQFRQERISND